MQKILLFEVVCIRLAPSSTCSISQSEMEKVGGTGDISLLFFVAGANLWVIFGQFWVIFGSFLGHFLVLIFFDQKFISAIFITFSISGVKV